jgi:peptide/nickel transport system substrate-binding protein
MKRQSEIPLAAAALAAALTLAACGGSSTGWGKSAEGFDGALHTVVNPSDRTGGTIVFDSSSSPDSTDPGNTYYADM